MLGGYQQIGAGINGNRVLTILRDKSRAIARLPRQPPNKIGPDLFLLQQV
jgi:hypothetical protein